MNKKVPILVLAFNRPDHVAKSMEAIREYQPDKLYLECDGARTHKGGERKAVEETRKAMLDSVDWPCEVKTLFREENLGCANAVYDAISWFFENEEYGCIIEDDVIVSRDFFILCEELLPRYKDCDVVMHINAPSYRTDNFAKQISTNEYVFGNAMYCWGWASWARAWKKMDMTMKQWPQHSIGSLIQAYGIFKGLMQLWYWHKDYKAIKEGKCNSWATRWNFAVHISKGLCISSKANLSYNIGTNCGTHYSEENENLYSNLHIGEIEFPLKLREDIALDKEQKKSDEREFLRIRMKGLRKKMSL